MVPDATVQVHCPCGLSMEDLYTLGHPDWIASIPNDLTSHNRQLLPAARRVGTSHLVTHKACQARQLQVSGGRLYATVNVSIGI